MEITIRPLEQEDIESIVTSFSNIGWDKRPSRYERYLREQQNGARMVLVAFHGGRFVGYLTIVWQPDYQPFRVQNVPEIQDLNVLPQVRRRGIATQLLEKAEGMIAQRSSVAGIGVGMTADYGAAQHLYVSLGYKPDGRGLVWKNEELKYGQQITVDDDLVLHFVKLLAP